MKDEINSLNMQLITIDIPKKVIGKKEMWKSKK